MKDKNFAKDVNREDIIKGTEELGVDLDEHINFIVESMKPIADVVLSGRIYSRCMSYYLNIRQID